jgi:uncharacterized protein (DUF39 family)
MENDYHKLKFGLEGLAIDDKIPIHNSEVLENCKTNEEDDVLMDVSDYNDNQISNIIEGLELKVERKDDNTLIIYGEFYSGPDVAPY